VNQMPKEPCSEDMPSARVARLTDARREGADRRSNVASRTSFSRQAKGLIREVMWGSLSCRDRNRLALRGSRSARSSTDQRAVGDR
jgi:hypothetical protein